jgi:hypothetical protein
MLKDAGGYTMTHNAEKAAVSMEGEREQNIAKSTVIELDKGSILVFYEDQEQQLWGQRSPGWHKPESSPMFLH